jgi:hypothetical protein
MDLQEMIDAIHGKACSPRRKGDGCDHPACEEVEQIANTLRRAIRVKGVKVEGEELSGWLIPD